MNNYFEYMNLYKKEEIIKQFILKYEINDDNSKIKIFFADGSCHLTEYSLITEKKILTRMKKQLIEYEDNLKKCFSENELESFKEIMKIFFAFFVTGIISLGLGLIFQTMVAYIFGIILGLIGGLGTGFIFALKIKFEKLFHDYQKNKMFLENETVINEMVNSKKSANMFANVNDKIKDACPVKGDGTCEFTINSIDKLSLKDMKRLLEIVKRELMIENLTEVDDELNKVKSKRLIK